MTTLNFKIPRKLKGFLTKKKRYKIAVGGRGSAKSQTIADILIHKCTVERLKILCMREFQSSIADSSYALLKSEINRIQVPGFLPLKTEIKHHDGGEFRFKGLARSIDAVKSTHGFGIGFIEEAQFLSDESIRIITPTFREEGSEIWMAANPMSSQDPFSQAFLNPFWDRLMADGYYEDDMHLIVMLTYKDNPFFPDVLEQERLKDFRILPRALYDHIWLGHFNDSIENSLISREWFDACVDAHKKLGFEAQGIRMSSHDPADEGSDSKAYAFRHGSVVIDVQEMISGDINDGGKWALGLTLQNQSDAFIWDSIGVGAGLKEQVSKSFDGKPILISQFIGGQAPKNPDALLDPLENSRVHNQLKNKEFFKNKRAQFYYYMRTRIFRTFRAVEHGEYNDPEKMIAFSSDISILSKVRSELCRMPIKPNPNGYFELWTKEVMRSKFKIPSPNLADSIMMLWDVPENPLQQTTYRPAPIRPMGRR